MDLSQRPKSMFRSFVVADLVTLANASCGMAAIFLCFNYVLETHDSHFWTIFFLLFLALICDILDGFIARRLASHSPFGADLDSLADVISFGVAPAVLGFTLGLRSPWDQLILIYFVVCGISRLARFNVTVSSLADRTGKVKYYEGTPIPSSIVIVALLGMAYWRSCIDTHILFGYFHIGPWPLHPFAIIYAISGSAMVSSTIHIPKP